MTAPLVLSLFPGIGLLDMAFEEEGFCVVRGPDLLWGGDVRRFHPPAGRFDGVIGGPPCQLFSIMKRLNPLAGEKHGNLIPEFERVVAEAAPVWFVMENVEGAPVPAVPGYAVRPELLRDVWVGGDTTRLRRVSFGTIDGRGLHLEAQHLAPLRRGRGSATHRPGSARGSPGERGGAATAARRRARPGTRGHPVIPAVLLTSLELEHLLERAAESGAER